MNKISNTLILVFRLTYLSIAVTTFSGCNSGKISNLELEMANLNYEISKKENEIEGLKNELSDLQSDLDECKNNSDESSIGLSHDEQQYLRKKFEEEFNKEYRESHPLSKGLQELLKSNQEYHKREEERNRQNN